ncbi:hypothetical protein NIES2119_30120 [[Phormidium ambiguum] IAM M-71]|uniref:Uncharacterized protein n=1 Tax=[Phormidium ambiguum] IAM M-71 TaxID=454136 RepID=A0A1U7I3U9_9CYAN|nr:hypothetical protein [Phormidium ambiguum]OKH30832.1 hypothetical protein NIES2119_30120 [Phormidium ambiguum IAM M-71]
MNDKKLATFRIDASQWKAFQEWARRSGTNASALLVEYIEECLNRAPTKGAKFGKEPAINIDKRIDSLDKRIAQLEELIAERMPMQGIPTSPSDGTKD